MLPESIERFFMTYVVDSKYPYPSGIVGWVGHHPRTSLFDELGVRLKKKKKKLSQYK